MLVFRRKSSKIVHGKNDAAPWRGKIEDLIKRGNAAKVFVYQNNFHLSNYTNGKYVTDLMN